jgi:hypothetical protein
VTCERLLNSRILKSDRLLAQLNEQTRSRVRSLGRTRGGPQVPPPVGAVRGFEAEQQQANQDARQKVAEILSPEQLEGFKQIIQSQPGADPLQLLVSDQVQQALGLSEDQVDQLRQIGDKARANTGSRSRSAATGSQAIAAARTQLDQQTRGARQQVAEILTPQQLQRLRQILVQVDGTALADPDLSDSLGLSPEQQRQLVTNQAEKFERIGSGFKAVRTRSGDPKAQCAAIVANRNQLDPILQQNRERTRGVLTPQQLAVLKQLEGQPLALDPPSCPAEVR